jgi:hypothetical protein
MSQERLEFDQRGWPFRESQCRYDEEEDMFVPLSTRAQMSALTTLSGSLLEVMPEVDRQKLSVVPLQIGGAHPAGGALQPPPALRQWLVINFISG